MQVLPVADISDRKYLAPKHPPVAKHQLLLKKAMVERGAKYTLCGNVHADDAYLGGELAGGKAGRGSKSKVPFFAGCPHRAIVADGHKPKDLSEFSWINTIWANSEPAWMALIMHSISPNTELVTSVRLFTVSTGASILKRSLYVCSFPQPLSS